MRPGELAPRWSRLVYRLNFAKLWIDIRVLCTFAANKMADIEDDWFSLKLVDCRPKCSEKVASRS